MKKAWFNYWNGAYKGDESTFYQGCDNKLIQHIEASTHIIYKEFNSYIKKNNKLFGEHFALDMQEDGGWSTICFKTWGIDVPSNKKSCPSISTLLDNNPEILSFSINKLKAGKRIKAHTGNTDAIWRFHVGLSIPDGLPSCGFKVKGISTPWEQGKAFGFCDAYEHEAWNLTNSDRIIICFDIIKTEFITQKKTISLKVRSFLILHYIATLLPVLQKLPKFIQRFFYSSIYALVWIIYPIQKKFGVLKSHD